MAKQKAFESSKVLRYFYREMAFGLGSLESAFAFLLTKPFRSTGLYQKVS